MSEQAPFDKSTQALEAASLPNAAIDTESSSDDQYRDTEALSAQIDISNLIEKLTQMRGERLQLSQIESRIESIDKLILLINHEIEKLNEEPAMLTKAIEEAMRRIEEADKILKGLRNSEADLEDQIDELDGKPGTESEEACAARRTELEKVRGQKENHRTVKQIQGRAINDLEIILESVTAKIQIQKTVYMGQLAEYGEEKMRACHRRDFINSELGKVAECAMILMTSIDNIVSLPRIEEMTPIPASVDTSDDSQWSGETVNPSVLTVTKGADFYPAQSSNQEDNVAYRLSEFAADYWLNPSLVVRSMSVDYEIPTKPELHQQVAEETDSRDGPLPYRQIFAQLPHTRQSVFASGNRKNFRTIINSVKN
jgi:hypothetical protein